MGLPGGAATQDSECGLEASIQNVVHLREELITNKGTQAPQSHLSWWFSA